MYGINESASNMYALIQWNSYFKTIIKMHSNNNKMHINVDINDVSNKCSPYHS